MKNQSQLYNLVKPNATVLLSYIAALREGFKDMQLEFGRKNPDEIEKDTAAFLELLNTCPPFEVKLPSGEVFAVQEHELFWIARGEEFLGSIALRYAADEAIIQTYAGHAGIAIRPALRNLGIAPRALRHFAQQLMQRMAEHAVKSVIITCNESNSASRRLIESLGGKLIKRNEDCFGTGANLVFCIDV